VRENLGDFRKSIQILTFLSPLPHVPLVWNKILNINTCMGHISGIWELLLYEYWRNWAISLKPRRRSRPLHLVWWALISINILYMHSLYLSCLYEISTQNKIQLFYP
jgi:hypothetical protein